MTTEPHQHAATFLDCTDGISDSAFASAMLMEMRVLGGDADTQADACECAAIHSVTTTVSLHGVLAFGSHFDEAAQNWRRIARWLTRPNNPLSEVEAQHLAWAVAAMYRPEILKSEDLLRAACKDVIRLAPMQETLHRHTASLFMAALPPAATAAAS